MRYNDCRDGTNVAEEVLSKYSAAWKEKGMTGENGLFISWYAPKQGTKKPATDIGFTAWLVLYKPRLPALSPQMGLSLLTCCFNPAGPLPL
jgi:hypothetical protein